MTDPDEDFAPPPPRPRLRRLRTFALWCLGFGCLVVVLLFLSRWQVGRLGERRLRAETARLDAEDPGWTLDAILANRRKGEPPPDRNAATEILSIADELPDDWKKWRNSEEAIPFWACRADNHLPPADAIDAARRHAAGTDVLRTRAIRLRDQQPSAFPLTVPADPLTTLLPHLDKARQVLSLLQHDAYLAAIDGNPDRGISAARSALAVARAIGDEPFLVSQLVRIASGVLAAQTATQVLAWGTPTEGLAELQTELFAEADVPYFRIGMRGERAVHDRVFRGLEDGTIPAEHWFRYADIANPGPEHYAAYRTYKALIPGDHAKALEILSQFVEASKLPPHEQLAVLRAVPIPKGPPEEFRYVLTRLLIPACDKIAEAGLRGRAELLAAATAIACERFRRQHGRWPGAVAELVPGFLPAVPLSPFDGKPVSYRVFPDRVAVYFWWAEQRNRAEEIPEEFRHGNPPGTGYGTRLWNPDRRGRPPEEKKNP